MTMVYVVTARRYGDREKHSYLVGVYDNEEAAWSARAATFAARANKYDCEIERVVISSGVNVESFLDNQADFIHTCPGHDLLNPPRLSEEHEMFAQRCVDVWDAGP